MGVNSRMKVRRKCVSGLLIFALSSSTSTPTPIGTTRSGCCIATTLLLLLNQITPLDGYTNRYTFDDDDDDGADDDYFNDDDDDDEDCEDCDECNKNDDATEPPSIPSNLKAQQRNARDNRAIMTSRPPPCLNVNPKCAGWASLGNCRKVDSRDYMRDNCPLACNFCNTLLEPLTLPLAVAAVREERGDGDGDGVT